MSIKNSLILSSIAGLSTCLGLIFTFIKPKDIKRFMTICLSLAMGVMSLISIKELIPIPLTNIFKMYNNYIAIFIIIACPLIANLIITLSKRQIKNSNNLYKLGILNMLTLFIHNVPEDYTH